MTKEELIKKLQFGFGNGESRYFKEIEDIVNSYHESNVCIHKGDNRHPYADVLHEWVEDQSLNLQMLSAIGNNWENNVCEIYSNMEYRIKPSEPVYEWQWYKISNSGFIIIKNEYLYDGEHQFFTEKEIVGFGWVKFEETKRERK